MKRASIFLLAAGVPLIAAQFVGAVPAIAAPAATTPATPAAAVPAATIPAAAPATTAPATTAPAIIPRPANVPAGVIATVNGDQIMMSDVNRAANTLQARDPDAQGDSEDARQHRAQIRAAILDTMIAGRLLVREAARLHIAPTQEEVDSLVVDFKQNNHLANDTELAAFLTHDGKTPADLRRLFSEQLATDKLASSWIADVTVTDADVADFYAKHQELFRESEQVRVRHILLAVPPGAPQADRDRIKAHATQLLAQARARNADFGALARANSDDPGSKTQGGDVGWFGRGMMVQAFEDAAFGGQVGQIVGPVETDFGYHIIKIEEKRPARVIPLEEVRNDPRLKQAVLEEKRQARVEAQVAALRAHAQIQRYGT